MSQIPNPLFSYARAFLALHARRPTPAVVRGCVAVYRALVEVSRDPQSRFISMVNYWFLDALRTQTVGRGVETSKAEFMNGMDQTLSEGLTAAWEAGAASVGIERDEISDEEYAACGEFIAEQVAYLPPVWDWIGTQVGNNTARQAVLSRAEVWHNLWNAAATKAKLMAGQDQKLEWVEGPTREKCPDCLKLNGKVYRASVWLKYDVMPQSHRLACHGFNCACELLPTDKRVTPGKPPALSGVRESLTEIGTGSSGNWGHAGIPGQQGGSAPGAGHSAIGGKENIAQVRATRQTGTEKEDASELGTYISRHVKVLGDPLTSEQKQTLREQLALHPPEVLKHIDSIEVCTTPLSAIQKWKEATGGKSPYLASQVGGWWKSDTRTLTLNVGLGYGFADGVLHHEMGHVIQDVSRNKKVWNQKYKDPKFDRSTAYSKTNVNEGFAETYEASVHLKERGGKAPASSKLAAAFIAMREVLSGIP